LGFRVPTRLCAPPARGRGLSLPVFVLLAILERVVCFILGALTLLGVLAAFLFKLIRAPHFPFVLMLGTPLGNGVTLIA